MVLDQLCCWVSGLNVLAYVSEDHLLPAELSGRAEGNGPEGAGLLCVRRLLKQKFRTANVGVFARFREIAGKLFHGSGSDLYSPNVRDPAYGTGLQDGLV